MPTRYWPPVTFFDTEIHPTDDGYDFAELKDMLAWRDQTR